MENNETLLILTEYVLISSYRKKTLKAIGKEHKIPTIIAKDSGLRVNHISKVLSELKNKGLIVCINPEVRKGRLYRATPLGLKVLELVENGMQ